MKDRKFTRVTAFGTAGGWSGKMEHQVTLQVWGEGFALVEDVRRIVEAAPAMRFALISAQATLPPPDRKSVVSGKSVSVRVDLGGRRIIKQKKTKDKLLDNIHYTINITV